MTIAVLGAAGRTGRSLMNAAAGRGMPARGVVRTASRSDPAWNATSVADGRDGDAVAAAIRGCAAVIFAIGPVAGDDDPRVMQACMRVTLAAMRTEGVRRLVTVSASGPFVAGDDPLTRFVAKPVLRGVLAEAFADLVAAESVVRESEAAWTIVRPPMLTDGPARSRYRSRDDGNVPFGFRIRRADLAAVVLDALAPRFIGQTIAVAQ